MTHGPLQVLAMAESLRAHPAVDTSGPGTFDYRLVSPLFDAEGLVVRTDPDGEGWATSARARSGAVSARGTYRPGVTARP